jgi:hypothetical protein
MCESTFGGSRILWRPSTLTNLRNEVDIVNGVFRRSRSAIVAFHLLLSALIFMLFGAEAQGQFKKGAKVPPNFDFGFVPGRKVFYEGVFRVSGDPQP